MTKSPRTLVRLLPVYWIVFIGFFGYSLMLTLFTPMFMHAEGGLIAHSASQSTRTILLGVALSLYPIGQFFGSPILGALSDHYGRRPILVFSLATLTLFYLLISYSMHDGLLIPLFIFLFFTGLTEGSVVVAFSAIADVTHDKNRSQYFGYTFLSASAAYIVGPIFGGRLADPHLVEWFDYSTPFWASSFLIFVMLIWTIVFFKETSTNLKNDKVNYSAAIMNILSIFRLKKVRRLYLINFLLYLSIFGFFRCYPMYLVDAFGMDVTRLSNYIAWVSVPIILANAWLTGKLAQYILPQKMTIITGIFTGIFMILIVIPHSVSALWVTLFLAGLATALCLPACSSLLSISVSAEEQGSIMGNNQSLMVSAEAISGIIGGLLAAALIKLPLILLALSAIAAALIAQFGLKKR